MKYELLIILLFCFFRSYSQSNNDTTYYDLNWNKTLNPDSMAFFGVKSFDNSGEGKAHYFYSTGELYSIQIEKNELKNGHCIWYYKNGKKMAEGDYLDDMPTGEQIRYNENGIAESLGVSNDSKNQNEFHYDLTKRLIVDSIISISLPEITQLYRGYRNIIQLGFKDGCAFDVGVSCSNCDTIYHLQDNQFVVVPGEAFRSFIEVYKIIDSDEYELISRTEYRISTMPDPNIYIGAANEKSPIYWKETVLFAKYPPEIWLNTEFKILEWEIRFGRKKYNGLNDRLTADVLHGIKKLKKGKRIELKVIVVGEDNEKRTIETYFTRAPDSWYEINEE